MYLRVHYFFVLLTLLLSGCSSTFDNLVDSAMTVAKLDDALDIEYIESLPYASAIIKVNDGVPVFFVLANAEYVKVKGEYRLTWLTQDSESVVTESGRIVNTVGFVTDNLEGLTVFEDNLSVNANSSGRSNILLARYDWSPGYRYGFSAQIETHYLGEEMLSTRLWAQDTEKFTETVSFDGLNAQIVNTYWRAPATEINEPYMLKSIQYLGPNMDKVEMSIVRPFVPPRQVALTAGREQL